MHGAADTMRVHSSRPRDSGATRRVSTVRLARVPPPWFFGSACGGVRRGANAGATFIVQPPCQLPRNTRLTSLPHAKRADRVGIDVDVEGGAAPYGRLRVPCELMHAFLCMSTSRALFRTSRESQGLVPELSTTAACESFRGCVRGSLTASYSPRCICWRMQAGEEGLPHRELGGGLRADFPVLHQSVNDRPLVYLDNAATSQKPTAVRSRRRRGV